MEAERADRLIGGMLGARSIAKTGNIPSLQSTATRLYVCHNLVITQLLILVAIFSVCLDLQICSTCTVPLYLAVLLLKQWWVTDQKC